MPDDDPLDDPPWDRIAAGRHGPRRVLLVVAAALVVVAGVAGAIVVTRDDPPQAVDTVDTTASTTSTVPLAAKHFHVSTTVLEDTEHGPELCLGGVADSLPPQCGGVPVTNWDWGAVDKADRRNGTTWGEYEVVGTYDGTSFTLTDTPAPPLPSSGHSDEGDPFASPCPTPPGGWGIVDPSKVSFEDQQAVMAAAGAEPDHAMTWVDATTRDPAHPEEGDDLATTVLNFAFTGDLERHETELRALWGGPLCVSLHQNRAADLERIQRELGDDPSIQSLGSGSGNVLNVVQLRVVYDDGSLQRRLDAKYGEGVVEVTSALQPVD